MAGLSLSEIFLTSFFFSFPTSLADWSNPILYAKKFAQGGILAFVAFPIIAWSIRGEIFELWNEAAGKHNWRLSVLTNVGLFVVLLLGTIIFSSLASGATEPPLYGFAAYCTLLLATGISLVFVAAPLSFWLGVLKSAPTQVAFALLSACFVLFASELSKASWTSLSTATLVLAHWILTLYDVNVFLDVERQLLGVGDFRVLISTECSGYEGIGLVVAFLALYTWIFRRELRFPNALLLFPIGVAAVWVLNSVRIAVLVSIGAHVSPAVAVNGFHSQAGWIGFLLVAIGVMAMSRRSQFFCERRLSRGTQSPIKPDQQLLLALLAPFVALMATSIVASAFAPNDQWLYGLKVLGVTTTLCWFRNIYIGFVSTVSPVSVVVGLAVGVLWIATEPGDSVGTPLGAWLASLPASLVAIWLSLRALGCVILIPVAEELAFRGYLHRALISIRFETVAPGQFGWLAFLASSLLFGLMHQRWMAASLAGAIYAVLMYRTNRLSDPIAAHMASNCAIMLWAVSMRQWALL